MREKPLFITIAQGRRYRELAHYQKRCLHKHGWDVSHIVIEKETPGPDRARDDKTGFAKAIPEDHEGPVILLDADCTIEGPQTPLPTGADVFGVCVKNGWKGLETCPVPQPVNDYLDAMFLIFRNATIARTISARWLKLWQSRIGRDSAWTDTFSLNHALVGFDAQEIPNSTGTKPYPNLLHMYRTFGKSP